MQGFLCLSEARIDGDANGLGELPGNLGLAQINPNSFTGILSKSSVLDE